MIYVTKPTNHTYDVVCILREEFYIFTITSGFIIQSPWMNTVAIVFKYMIFI